MVFRLFTADFWAKAQATSSGQGGHAAAKATASAQPPEFASDIFSLSQRKTHINPPFVVEGSLGVKLPTIWTDEKQSRAEAERGERLEERRVEEKESEERRCRCAKR